MKHEDKPAPAPAAGEQWEMQIHRFGLTQEQTHAVPAVWRRRRQRLRLKQQTDNR